ncbi:hypothetical protein ACJMK2_005074 [Sinanodonta woodiana]|uniref:Peroxidase n=1 Tax=Sinanodonta woodiana TaxID=1069815 RepID=A0ABD3VNZ1_SINWO
MGLWSISTVLLLVSLDKIKLASSCKQWEKYTDEQLHKIISTAVQNAEVSHRSIQTLNEYLSNIELDESPTKSSQWTYHRHYAVFKRLNHAASSSDIETGIFIDLASTELARSFDASIKQLAVCPRIVEIWLKLIRFRCKPRKVICFPGERYRRLTGGMQQSKISTLGDGGQSGEEVFTSRIPGCDVLFFSSKGVSIPRQLSVNGHPLPSARMVSNIVHRQDPCCPLRERDLSLYVMQWGQMVDHDIVDTAGLKGAGDSSIMCCNISRKILEKRPECFPIYIPKGDLHFENDCMNFVRNLPAKDDWCRLVNQATSFLDASFLYGQSHEDSKSIRAFKRGMLRMTPSGLFPPPGSSDTRSCRLESQEHYCMKSGDFRIHVMPGLTSIQVMFLREHNRIAFILGKLNPLWNDEDIYSEARKIVIGQLQHITYAHWLPYIVGPDRILQYGLKVSQQGYANVYDDEIDPTIANEFAVAPFRFAHTLLQDTVPYLTEKAALTFRSEDMFNKPTLAFSNGGKGVSYVGFGLSQAPLSKADEKVVTAVRDNLFKDMDGRSLDLVSLNIQRSRDHGVPGYNSWRKFCGLPYAFHFGTGPGGLVHHRPKNARKLQLVYGHPDDIDLFPGGLSETPMPGGVVGPLFSCIIAQQFSDLKRGDRFYYENGFKVTGFTPAQLDSIKTASLPRLMCTHFHLNRLQVDPFRLPSDDNQLVDCSIFPEINLELWRV